MKKNIPEIEELVKLISKLPGLGPKSARRIVLKLINNKEELTGQNIVINSYTPDEISIEVQGINTPLVLISTNSFSPHWKCYVNGEKRRIFPTYGTFWGIVVRPGDNSITFRYEPPYAIF